MGRYILIRGGLKGKRDGSHNHEGPGKPVKISELLLTHKDTFELLLTIELPD